MSKEPTALESLKANEQLLKIMDKHTKAYYDRCIKRIKEESFRDGYDIKILTTDFILLILKEELTK